MKKEAVEEMKKHAEYYQNSAGIYEFGFYDGYKYEKISKKEIMDLLTEFSEPDLSVIPNSGEIRVITDSNWDDLADALLSILSI